jgi:peptidyl-prolyl cis-trans isomerase B (cyclophilin B)
MPTPPKKTQTASRNSGGRAAPKAKMSRQAARHKPAPKPRNKQTMLMYGIIALMVVLAMAIVFWPTSLGAPITYRIETEKGDIILDVYPKVMPITAANFERLVADSFYDGLLFHRVEDWVVQGGEDPEGGPDWTIPLEVHRKLNHVRGAVGMARTPDPNSANSQFYIVKKNAPTIDGQYAVFAKVTKGMDVVDQLEIGDKMISVTRVTPTP